jgi:hypothetical protein
MRRTAKGRFAISLSLAQRIIDNHPVRLVIVTRGSTVTGTSSVLSSATVPRARSYWKPQPCGPLDLRISLREIPSSAHYLSVGQRVAPS